MTRRDLFAQACAWTSLAAALRAQHSGRMPARPGAAAAPPAGPADVTLRIGETSHELAPGRVVKTLAYNGQVPGPVLRAPRGRPLVVDVVNDAKDEDIVHWHGLHLPSDVDGAYEEGTPGVPPGGGRQRYVITPEQAGTRWYHTHNAAGRDLKRGTYTGQFGLFLVDGGGDPGAYDQEVLLLLHEFEPSFRRNGPMDVEFKTYTINGRVLGAADPIRVQAGQRVLFRIVNASATLAHQVALSGHQFRVIALDGNPVPTPLSVPILDVAPGERVDAVVEMNRPGVWVCGAVKAAARTAGLGIVVEYAGSPGPPRWEDPVPRPWDYTVFGTRLDPGQINPRSEPDARLTLAFRATGDGHHWTINGKAYPKTDPIAVQAGRRYRWRLDNQSADPHPVHLHRHTFELVSVAGRTTSGVRKDVVVVPPWQQVEIDVTADNPGPTLFHCHQQFHMDMGFMAMMHYR